MLLARIVVGMLPVGLIVLSAGVACGQDYPGKPIRMISPGPGGGADFVARFIAQGISGPLGQQVVVENRPAGVIPGQIVSKAPPDGYTLLVNGNSFWIAPLMRDHTFYDPVKDFSPITSAVGSPNILVVHSSVAANSVKELTTGTARAASIGMRGFPFWRVTTTWCDWMPVGWGDPRCPRRATNGR